MKKNYDNQIKAEQKNYSSIIISIITLISAIASLQIATQYFANYFNYQAVLGSHFHHIYAPWKIIVWFEQWNSQYLQILMKSVFIGVIPLTIVLLILIAVKQQQRRKDSANAYLHGSARWANKKDITAMGLLKKEEKPTRIVIGSWMINGSQEYLYYDGDSNALCYAPTRSGKGVGLVIPTLLTWLHSAFITDLKGELWALTAGFRKHVGQTVLKFEPASETTIHWNPLDEIRVGTVFETGDIQNLCTLIVDPDGKGLTDHWAKTGFALLSGLVAHLLYKNIKTGETASLATLDQMLASPNRDIGDLWVEMTTYEHIVDDETGEITVHPLAAAAGQDMIDKEAREASSVLSTVKSFLVLYRDPVIANAISSSDFKMRDLMNSSNPVSLYIVTQPRDKDRLRPLVRIVITMMIRLLADDLTFENGRPKASYKYKLLCMIDEFPSLGKLDILQESLAFVAGYGLKFYLICQDITQLRDEKIGYGKDEKITSNCHIQNAYPPNRIETAEHLSKLTGETTIIDKKISVSKQGLWGKESTTTSYNETKRPLLTPDECARLPPPIKNGDLIKKAGDMIIYMAGYPAIYGRQILYFQNKVFLARTQLAAPEQSDTVKRLGDNTLDKIKAPAQATTPTASNTPERDNALSPDNEPERDNESIPDNEPELDNEPFEL